MEIADTILFYADNRSGATRRINGLRRTVGIKRLSACRWICRYRHIHLERGLRPIPMGRRNWLFAWTELGARRVGAIQSLLATCQLQDVNPYIYLVDVLQRIDRHPARRVVELTPRVWKTLFADNPLRSDLDRARDPPLQ